MKRRSVDRGARYGEGLFETLLMIDGELPLLEAHLARMRVSAKRLGLPCPRNLKTRVRRGSKDAWRATDRPPRAAMRVRLTCSGEPGLVSASKTESHVTCDVTPIEARPFGRPSRSVTAVIVDGHRVDPGSALSGHKTLSWLAFVIARREARNAGADVALLCTVDGDVAEADFANLFAVLDGRVLTPPLDRGVFPGITRTRAMAALERIGRPASEERLWPADLARVDEVFLTSSLSGVTPVSTVDRRALGSRNVARLLARELEGPDGPRPDPEPAA